MPVASCSYPADPGVLDVQHPAFQIFRLKTQHLTF